MGYFVMATNEEPLELIECIKANINLYLDKLPEDAQYKYLLSSVVQRDLDKLKIALEDELSKDKEI